ncbi:MAG TPA: outer membrane beta-barrel protein [Vicinamibacterales bacterium]|nr:outer membrane beta-barrel protein [Vicinamibacterales bacterium]
MPIAATRTFDSIVITAALLLLVVWSASATAYAQDDSRAYAGVLFGVSTLSADGRSDVSGSTAAVSLYKPENGLAINVFGGAHVWEYVSIQANWIWNRNDLTLVSALAAPQGGGYYEQQRNSRQHAAVLDGLLYFRRRDSRVRPYLGTGLSFVHFSSDVLSAVDRGIAPPAGVISSLRVALRSHVGIDIRLSRHAAFRYSFSETIGANPISPLLTPPAPRGLANFQNLFGLVARF